MEILNMTHSIPKTNYGHDKNITPQGICLHITGDLQKGKTLEWFQNKKSKVSAHYIIERDGTIILCVYANKKAYHCGNMNMPSANIIYDNGRKNPNNYLIGIEVVSDGRDINDIQFTSLKELILELSATYNIPIDRYSIIGHYEIDFLNKPFDPILSYHPKMIIESINQDKKLKMANKRLNYLQLDLNNFEMTKIELENANKEIRKLEKQNIKLTGKLRKKSWLYNVLKTIKRS